MSRLFEYIYEISKLEEDHLRECGGSSGSSSSCGSSSKPTKKPIKKRRAPSTCGDGRRSSSSC